MKNDLSEEELLRYSRQIMLPAFDVSGQLALANAKVLIVGLGGLGSPVALYLAAAGVGKLILADHDRVDLSNLQRQIAHEQASLGQAKCRSAGERVSRLNPNTEIECLDICLAEEGLSGLIAGVDLVLDCCDNFSTRFAINKVCVQQRTPLVSGAAIRMEGQLAVFDARLPEAPCYQCLYSHGGDEELSCSESGVLSPLVGVIGSMQALEAIKVISGLGSGLAGYLMIYDALHADWRKLRLRKDPQCPVCASS
ncbi:MAG: molybdopterin-synthase adenylyltransferase MoeB [Oleiphilus sp.]|nr:MAG: molybdopterin-synthase adenylyltransferase MoeB [Oleiphilus sp.]